MRPFITAVLIVIMDSIDLDTATKCMHQLASPQSDFYEPQQIQQNASAPFMIGWEHTTMEYNRRAWREAFL